MNYNRFIEPSTLAEQQRLAGVEVIGEGWDNTKPQPYQKTKHGEMNPPRITPKILAALILKVGTTDRNVEVIPGMRKPRTVFANGTQKTWIRVGAKWLDRHGY